MTALTLRSTIRNAPFPFSVACVNSFAQQSALKMPVLCCQILMANFGIVESDSMEGRWDADEAARARRRPIDL